EICQNVYLKTGSQLSAVRGAAESPYPSGCDSCHFQAELIMSWSAGIRGTQFSTSSALVALATRCDGSPARRDSKTTFISLPVMFRAASITSRTEYPCPLPRFMAMESPPAL